MNQYFLELNKEKYINTWSWEILNQNRSINNYFCNFLELICQTF